MRYLKHGMDRKSATQTLRGFMEGIPPERHGELGRWQAR
jgi:hypothetical protein